MIVNQALCQYPTKVRFANTYLQLKSRMICKKKQKTTKILREAT